MYHLLVMSFVSRVFADLTFIFSAKQKSSKPPVSQPEPEFFPPTIDVPELSLDDLKQKTDDFGSSALIGEGSYGRVYHATLDDGRQAAVKKLDASENEPNDEFLKQVGTDSTLSFLTLCSYSSYVVDNVRRGSMRKYICSLCCRSHWHQS